MVVLDEKHLLFIEPKNKPSKQPVFDEYTERMQKALNKATKGKAYRGVHCCSCGQRSSNCDLFVERDNGIVFFEQTSDFANWRRVKPDAGSSSARKRFKTNSLAVHYLAFHRDEVPKEELEKIITLAL